MLSLSLSCKEDFFDAQRQAKAYRTPVPSCYEMPFSLESSLKELFRRFAGPSLHALESGLNALNRFHPVLDLGQLLVAHLGVLGGR